MFLRRKTFQFTFSKREIYLMAKAEKIAMMSELPNRHGCIVAVRRKIVGLGWNKGKTHPAASKTISQHIHAELAAIIGVNAKDLRGADIFVARKMRGKGQDLGMSRPCKHCLELIRQAGVKWMYYTVCNPDNQNQGEWYMEKV